MKPTLNGSVCYFIYRSLVLVKSHRFDEYMKAFKWIATVLLGIIVVGMAFVFFSPGYNMHTVMSESMKPSINVGDMIVTGPPYGPLGQGMQTGAIVTYQHGDALITHRVLSGDYSSLVTKGDAAEEADPWPVSVTSVTGTYLFKIPYLGYVSNFMRTKTGWFVVVIIPAFLFVAYLIKEILKEAFRKDEKYADTKRRSGTM